jgi:hypothetical protein
MSIRGKKRSVEGLIMLDAKSRDAIVRHAGDIVQTGGSQNEQIV